MQGLAFLAALACWRCISLTCGATGALPTTATTITRSATQLINGRTNLSIELEFNGTSFFLNWQNLLNAITEPALTELWTSAEVAEDLRVTLQKRQSLFFPNKTAVISGDGHRCTCEVPTSSQTYNITKGFNYSALPGHLGGFGINARLVLGDIFASKWSLFARDTPEYRVFYPMNVMAVKFSISIGNNESGVALYGVVSEDFVVVTLHNRSKEANETASHLLFGLPDSLPSLKGHATYDELTFARNAKYALVAILPKDSYQTLLTENYTRIFLNMTESTPLEFTRTIQTRILSIEARRACAAQEAAPDIFLVLFQMLVAHFLVARGIAEHQFVEVDCVCRQYAELYFLRRISRLCMPTFTTVGYNHTTLGAVAATQIARVSATKLASLPRSSQETVLAMVQLGARNGAVPSSILEGIAMVVEHMYTAYTYVYTLGDTERKLMLDIHTVLTDSCPPKDSGVSEKLLRTYLMFTSMCTNIELGEMIARFSKPDSLNIYRAFSPCFLGLRYDLHPAKLRAEAPQSSALTRTAVARGTSGFAELLHALHLDSLNLIPAINCSKITADKIIATVPLPHVTYIISSEAISNAVVYEVSEIFLKSAMFISAIKPDCSGFNFSQIDRHIPIVYNISTPRRGCPLCDSVIMSYDESDGLQSLMYVTNERVQANLFLDKSPFFDNNNLHIHYLWLRDNGTVVEIRGMYRRRAASALFLILSFIGFSGVIYFLYRLFSILY